MIPRLCTSCRRVDMGVLLVVCFVLFPCCTTLGGNFRLEIVVDNILSPVDLPSLCSIRR
jgi:hypothetical protein